MALIDGNTRKIAGTDIEISNIFICCTRPPIYVKSAINTEVTIYYQVYETADKWQENETDNLIKIEELQRRRITFDYNRSIDGDIFEYIDIKMKEDILSVFRNSDPNLIIFQPPHN